VLDKVILYLNIVDKVILYLLYTLYIYYILYLNIVDKVILYLNIGQTFTKLKVSVYIK
jgi:hypothetical protein